MAKQLTVRKDLCEVLEMVKNDEGMEWDKVPFKVKFEGKKYYVYGGRHEDGSPVELTARMTGAPAQSAFFGYHRTGAEMVEKEGNPIYLILIKGWFTFMWTRLVIKPKYGDFKLCKL